MSDERSLEEKLAAMATQVVQSPREAAIAASVLEKLRSTRQGETPPRSMGPHSISRETILSSPDRAGPEPRSMRVKIGRDWVNLTSDEYELVTGNRLFDLNVS